MSTKLNDPPNPSSLSQCTSNSSIHRSKNRTQKKKEKKLKNPLREQGRNFTTDWHRRNNRRRTPLRPQCPFLQ
ncbi:hypothetical protein CEXT_808731 [Caerostris extrusa]|uniref:Uncharacterized protein n=1 Tax=Caerostris extrusa TaxID=172846 RepID=A0AAV4MTN2_CAEEX|nr:hypothetical protein CEXT_808731 [Caerostris extrusa]